jgi:arylsulfatase A-like enzyme
MELNGKNDKNLILITVDCLRADHLHCMGYTKKITPTLDNLANNGVLFTNVMANGPNTMLSVPSFLTSTLPPVKINPNETLANILKKHGYATKAYNPNPILYNKKVHKNSIKGFDSYDMILSNIKRNFIIFEIIFASIMKFYRRHMDKKGNLSKKKSFIYEILLRVLSNLLYTKQYRYGPSAEDINKKALFWIKNQKGKFFLWLHYMDVHEPYYSEDYKDKKELRYLITKYRYLPNMLTSKEIKKIIDLYDLGIKYVDNEINKFLKELKSKNHFENSIIIISADHGDAFGEHGTFGHGGKYYPQLYDEVLHVPLIIYNLKQKGIKIDRQVQLLDLAPTICKMLKIPTSPQFFGRSFFNPSNCGIIVNCRTCIGYRTNNFKLIIYKTEKQENELYDLKKDPKETKNIYNKEKKITNKLEKEMIILLNQYKKKMKLFEISDHVKLALKLDFFLKIQSLIY